MENALLTRVKKFISQNPINIHKDQFFVINSSVVEKLIEIDDINFKDIVLEVGSGIV